MKAIIVYKSLSGYTEKYARWIADDLDADLRERRRVNPEDLLEYDVIVFGGSLHAVGINGVDIIKENMEKFTDKKIIVFATGASPCRPEIMEEVKNRNFTPEDRNRIRFYYYRGGFDYSKLNLVNKFLMTLMKWKIRRKPEQERTPDEKGMLAAFDNPVDFTKKENIADLVEYTRSCG